MADHSGRKQGGGSQVSNTPFNAITPPPSSLSQQQLQPQATNAYFGILVYTSMYLTVSLWQILKFWDTSSTFVFYCMLIPELRF